MCAAFFKLSVKTKNAARRLRHGTRIRVLLNNNPTEGSAAHAEGAVNGHRYTLISQKTLLSIGPHPRTALCRPFLRPSDEGRAALPSVGLLRHTTLGAGKPSPL